MYFPVRNVVSLPLDNDGTLKPKEPKTQEPKLSYRRETARELRTFFLARSLIVHFTGHRISCTTIID